MSHKLYGKKPASFYTVYNRKEKKSRDMYQEIDLNKIDINSNPPMEEPARQYYFMAKCREWVQEFERKNDRRPTALIQTFGCQMNARDSEKILGILKCIGYTEAGSEDADLVVFNTCTVRENANLKVYGRIGQLKKYKAKNPGMVTMVCGCIQMGKLCRLDDRDLRVATTTGMAAFFTALFGTPLAAAIFAIAVVSVDAFYHAALFPALTAALEAYGISLLLGVEPTHFTVSAPGPEAGLFLRTAVLAVLCALLSTVFCGAIHLTERLLASRLPNPWLRAFLGGAAVAAMTLLCGVGDYNGAGMSVIAAAVEEGTAHPAAFILKLLFTAVTLGAGFKGGEVVPSFFVGAAFGCVAGPLLGLPAGFAAALGLVSVFCGAVNCPLASIALSVELFGGEGLLYFALACCVSYMLSGYNGLYSSQTFLHSKLKAQYINIHTNERSTGEVEIPEETAAPRK